MEKSGLKPSVPALPFGLGGLGASSQWIFGIWGHLQFYTTCFYILYYIYNFYRCASLTVLWVYIVGRMFQVVYIQKAPSPELC